MLRLHRSVLLALIASVTWDCTIAERLRNDEYSYTGIRQSDDLLFSRYVGLRSSSVRASKSGKDDSSPKSSKSSSSKSSKSSYYSSKSSKSTKAQDYMTSMGKSAKASYYVDGSNDFGAPFLPSNGNSNDVAVIFEDSSSLTENSEFFPIIFQPPHPELLMAATDNPTSKPTPLPSKRPTPQPSAKPTANPTFKPTISPTAVSLPCGIAATARSEEVLRILNVDLSDPDSPQSLALDWITNKDGLYLCPDDEAALIQRYVAAVFYFSTGGGSWNQCNAPEDLGLDAVERANEHCRIRAATFPDLTSGSNAWLTASSECEWGGLACLPDGSIGELSFENNGLDGSLPVELKEWKELRRLALQQGRLSGKIPPELSLLTNLLVLDLDYNDLTGPLPGEMFSNWTVLKELDLNNNFLDGTISTRIGELTDLRFLQLDSNDFTGTIPSQLGRLEKLIFMSVADLNLNGIMPSQVCLNRGEPTNPENGNLAVLIADCDSADQRVFCECCSDCGIQEQGAIVSQLAPFWIAQRDES